MMFISLLYLTMSFLIASSNPYKKEDKTISQIGLKISPLKETFESNTKYQSQMKYSETQNNMRNQQNGSSLLKYVWNLVEKAGNNLSPKPSNPQLFTMLRIIIIPKKSVTSIHPNDKHPGVVPITEAVPTITKEISTTTKAIPTTPKPISTSTEAVSTTPKAIPTTEHDDDDDTTRPIKFKDIKTFDFGRVDKLSRKMPDVEHGSIQYTT